MIDTIQRHARHLGDTGIDLRASASAWSMEYLETLLPPVIAATSVLQHGFPMYAEEVAVELDVAGTPKQFHIRREGVSMTDEPAVVRYDDLLWQHLEPLFAALSHHTRLPRKILWGNAARHLENIFDQILTLIGDTPRVNTDLNQLLNEPTWPNGRANPLYGKRREKLYVKNGVGTAIRLHRQCCLYYRLPNHDYCGACPLAPEHH